LKTAAESNSLVLVGKVVDAKALKGELKVLLFSGEAFWNKKVKVIYLKKADGENPQPFNLVNLKPEGGKFILKLSEVHDRTTAEKLKGCEVWIESSLFATTKGETVYLRELLGFELIADGRAVGTIKGFDSNVAQDLLVVELKGVVAATALVPLIKEFLVRIDHEKKTVEMMLPEGLLELETKKESESETE
jgi:16S rRNA processing protein RimM